MRSAVHWPPTKEALMKILAALILFQFSLYAVAQDCARNMNELKALVGNSSLPSIWKENTNNKSRQLTLRLSNAGGTLSLDLSVPGGNWARVTGEICATGNRDSFVARVSSMNWGPEAPGLVKLAGKPRTIGLTLPYQSLLKVRAKGMSFDFSPL
jgi:hypothetical protein